MTPSLFTAIVAVNPCIEIRYKLKLGLRILIWPNNLYQLCKGE